jgi:chromate reductase, NAD(P)H dehydrogenase (quinone)
MITIINGTNRPNNMTQHFVKYYQNVLLERGEEVKILEMEALPDNYISYMYGRKPEKIQVLIDEFILPSSRLILVSPEYNGTFPGIIKLFFDSIAPKHFHNKKVALVGVSDGRAGNLRGLDMLTHICHHLQMQVLAQKVYLSKLHELLNENNELVSAESKTQIERQLNLFLNSF